MKSQLSNTDQIGGHSDSDDKADDDVEPVAVTPAELGLSPQQSQQYEHQGQERPQHPYRVGPHRAVDVHLYNNNNNNM